MMDTAIIQKALSFWNGWWYGESVPDSIPRMEYMDNLIPLLDMREIVVLMGVRRSGKSTLLYQMIEHLLKTGSAHNICYITFDDNALIPFAKDPDFLQTVYEIYLEEQGPVGRVFLFFDEIQNIQSWEAWVKKMYDKNRDVKFIITGSSSALLQKEYSSLLTGRVITTGVYPLSFSEYLTFTGLDLADKTPGYLLNQKPAIKRKLSGYMRYGGFPEVVLQELERFKVEQLKNYFTGIIARDVLLRYSLRDASKIEGVSHLLLTSVAAPVSARRLGNTLGISPHTVLDYIRILEEVCLVQTLPFFSYSLKEQMSRQKKIYCIDSGIRNAIGFTFSKDVGRTAENIVFLSLKRRGSEVFYWKNEKGWEVDFVVKSGLAVGALVQVCWDLSGKSETMEVRALNAAMEYFNLKKSTMITEDTLKEETIGENVIEFVPLWLWLLKNDRLLQTGDWGDQND
ncbi:MAG: ATP-binding protein [Euryarchaeota archaeon]|nr:ATP-binding protein [Euryarchaeota archaeon]